MALFAHIRCECAAIFQKIRTFIRHSGKILQSRIFGDGRLVDGARSLRAATDCSPLRAIARVTTRRNEL
jgi:hypothetical protein